MHLAYTTDESLESKSILNNHFVNFYDDYLSLCVQYIESSYNKINFSSHNLWIKLPFVQLGPSESLSPRTVWTKDEH